MVGGPSGSTLLALYERGVAAGPAERAALLCAACEPGIAARDLPLGDLDRRIWALHRRLFAGPLAATAACKSCGALMEFDLPTDFGLPAASAGDAVQVRHGDRTFRVALPRLGDIGSATGLHALCPEAPWTDPAFVARAEAAIEAADPGMRLRIGLTCHACGTVQSLTFDIAAFLWSRIEQAARRLIRETARLARAFGWSEAEILAMSARRRALYLAEIPQ